LLRNFIKAKAVSASTTRGGAFLLASFSRIICKSSSHHSSKSQFLLGIIGGAGFAWLAKDPLEKQLSSIVAQQINFVPDKVSLPEAPNGVLEFKTTNAQFNAAKYSGTMLPTFEVTQVYHKAKQSLACSYRKQVVEHLP
jgi:hypothetical protein